MLLQIGVDPLMGTNWMRCWHQAEFIKNRRTHGRLGSMSKIEPGSMSKIEPGSMCLVLLAYLRKSCIMQTATVIQHCTLHEVVHQEYVAV